MQEPLVLFYTYLYKDRSNINQNFDLRAARIETTRKGGGGGKETHKHVCSVCRITNSTAVDLLKLVFKLALHCMCNKYFLYAIDNHQTFCKGAL